MSLSALYLQNFSQLPLDSHANKSIISPLQIFAQQNFSEQDKQRHLQTLSYLNKPRFQGAFNPTDSTRILQILLFLRQSDSLCSSLSHKDLFKEREKPLVEALKKIKGEFGESLFLYVTHPVCYEKATIADALHLLQLILSMRELTEAITPLLNSFFEQKVSLTLLLSKMNLLKKEYEEKKFQDKELDRVLEAFASDPLVAFPLSLEELSSLRKEYETLLTEGKNLKQLSNQQLLEAVLTLRGQCSDRGIRADERIRLLALAREAFLREFGILPYNTQILTILGLIHYPSHFKGRIAQVLTGEGKSTIMSLLIFYFASQDKSVNVITSDGYLAMRDQQKFMLFFNKYQISSSHISTDNPTEENFKGQVLFGTCHHFAFAWMRKWLGIQDFLKITRNGKVIPRPSEVNLYDELDNLLVDRSLDAGRIAIPGRESLNWIYAEIYAFVKRSKNPTPQLLREHLHSYQEGALQKIIQQIQQSKLEMWIDSAQKAQNSYQLNRDYVIKPIEENTFEGRVCREKVVIVDYRNTGDLLERSEWQRGLHQFLHVKHQLPVKEEGLMPASISNGVFAQEFEVILGVTGTMGGKIIRSEVESRYQLYTSFDVPPHKKNLRKLESPLFFFTQSLFYQAILKEIEVKRNESRPTLILFETIRESEEFFALLQKENNLCQLLNGRQKSEEEFVVERIAISGMATVATNKAGRGKDPHLTAESKKSGGLHVIYASKYQDERTFMQGIGRGARNGDPGSARWVVLLAPRLEVIFTHLSLEKQIDFLRRERERVALAESRHREINFEMESINHRFLIQFVSQFKVWQEQINDKMLENLDLKLRQLKLEKSSYTLRSLSKEEQKLHRQMHYKFSTHRQESWVPLLKSARALIKQKILQDWSEFFYHNLDDLTAEVLQKHKAKEEILKNYQIEIQALYNKNREQWESQLVNPRVQFANFLLKLIQTSSQKSG